MSDNRYTSYGGLVTVMTSELDSTSFTANATVVSSSIDNTLLLHFWDDVELVCTFPATPQSNAVVELYLLQSVDGSNYVDGSNSIVPPATSLVGVFPIRAVNTVQRVSVRGIQLPPGLFKYALINKAGIQSSGTSNTLKRRPYSTQSIIVS